MNVRDRASRRNVPQGIDRLHAYLYTRDCIFIQSTFSLQAPMKTQRQNAILKLISTVTVTSQDELRRRLARQGFDVTQATLSRDLHELRLFKGPAGYSLPQNAPDEDDDLPSFAEMMASFGLSVQQALNQL